MYFFVKFLRLLCLFIEQMWTFLLFFNFDDVLKSFFVQNFAVYINIWDSRTLT